MATCAMSDAKRLDLRRMVRRRMDTVTALGTSKRRLPHNDTLTHLRAEDTTLNTSALKARPLV